VLEADNLPPSSADVTESGSLNLPEPCGSDRPVTGMFFFSILFHEIIVAEFYSC
jgi:hypothetical protein